MTMSCWQVGAASIRNVLSSDWPVDLSAAVQPGGYDSPGTVVVVAVADVVYRPHRRPLPRQFACGQVLQDHQSSAIVGSLSSPSSSFGRSEPTARYHFLHTCPASLRKHLDS